MRKNQLNEQDVAIGTRLKYAREEVLELNQAACARSLKLDRTTLANYENLRTPLRFEVALQFCRHFVISEEWLATGECKLFHQAQPFTIPAPTGNQGELDSFDRVISMRHCVDLWSDPVTRHIKPGMPFSTAYRSALMARYAKLVQEFSFFPFVRLSDADSEETANNYITALHELHFNLLRNRAFERKIQPHELWRVYCGCVIETNALIWDRLMGKFSTANAMERFGWLRCVLADPKQGLPPLVNGVWHAPSDLEKLPLDFGSATYSLQNIIQIVNNLKVPLTFRELLERLNSAASGYGKKSALAAHMGVALTTISVWLSGKREPGGETTLRLLEWVLAEEAKTKNESSGHVDARPEQRTRLRKSDETKPESNPAAV